MNIVTGYRGEPHVTSQQERNTNIGIFGSNAHIIGGVNSELEATVVSANLVEISDGMIVCEGCTAEIPRGTNDSLVIENGEQGMKRIDLIVARYTKNGNTAAESMELAVIKGTSAANDPVAPSYNTGSIADGDSPVDFPLYRVDIDGISITSVTRLVDIAGITSSLTEVNNKIGNTAMGTVATTIIGAINELLTKITVLNTRLDTAGTDINHIGNRDYNQGISFITVALGTFNFNSAGAAEGTVNVASKVPSGFTLASVIPRTTGTYSAFFYSCQINGSNVYFQIMRAADGTTSCSPTVTIICKRYL